MRLIGSKDFFNTISNETKLRNISEHSDQEVAFKSLAFWNTRDGKGLCKYK